MQPTQPLTSVAVDQQSDDVRVNIQDQVHTSNQKPISTLCQKIMFVAKTAFLILLGVALFLYSPTLLLASLAIGVVFAKQANQAIKKIDDLWKSKPWAVVLIATGSFVFGLPSALLVTTALTGVYLGSQLYQWGAKENFQAVAV